MGEAALVEAYVVYASGSRRLCPLRKIYVFRLHVRPERRIRSEVSAAVERGVGPSARGVQMDGWYGI